MKDKNPVTGELEPAFPKKKRTIRMIAGFSTILFMVIFNFDFLLHPWNLIKKIYTKNFFFKFL